MSFAPVAIPEATNLDSVPDFRSSTGLFKSLKSEHKLKASGKQLFDASVYQTDSSTSTFHDMVRSMSKLVSEAEPTAFHQMLSDISRDGHLLRLYTQNVDGLDVNLPGLETQIPLSPKGPWPTSVQLHGGLAKMTCAKCNKVTDFDAALFSGPEPPPCDFCVEADRVRTDHAGKRSHGIGRLRPRMVLYNEHNPDQDAIGSVVSADLRARPDAVIVVGTSMKIPGVRRIVREMCGVVRGRRDGLAVWINRDGPPLGKEFEDCWDLVVKGPCDEVAHQYGLSFLDQKCTSSDVESAKEKASFQVEIPSPKKQPIQMLTPAASPAPKRAEVKQKIFIKLKVSPQSSKEKKASAATKPNKPAKPKDPSKASKPRAKPGPKKSTKPPHPSAQLTSTFKLSKPSSTTAQGAANPKSKPKNLSRSGTSTPKSSPKKSHKRPPSSPHSRSSSPDLQATRPSLSKSRALHHQPQQQQQQQHHSQPPTTLFPGLLKPDPDTGPTPPNSQPSSNPSIPKSKTRPKTLPAIDFARASPRPDPLTPPGSRAGLTTAQSHSPNQVGRTAWKQHGLRPTEGEEEGEEVIDTGAGIHRKISSSPPPCEPLSSPVLGPVRGRTLGESAGGDAGAEAEASLLPGTSGEDHEEEEEEEQEEEESFVTAAEERVHADCEWTVGGRGEDYGEGKDRAAARARSGASSRPGEADEREKEGEREREWEREREREMERGTVSPRSVPRGMEMLLCS